MEMLRDIDQETVDFAPNYDGRSQEPTILPSRIPNLLVNGSSGIAVGMATNIPPHNLREVAPACSGACAPRGHARSCSTRCSRGSRGPGLPDRGLIVGPRGHRGGVPHRPRLGPHARGHRGRRGRQGPHDPRGHRAALPGEPGQPGREDRRLVRDGKIGGIADVRDEGSQRTGQRLVIVLKRDAVAKVVLNNLYKHTQLQDTFGCNMLAIVDGVPRTLRLDEFVAHYVAHQVDVIVRRTRFQLRKAEERAHILRALGKALDRLDDVIALIRARRARRPPAAS
jgi:DNA gyrase subunit A